MQLLQLLTIIGDFLQDESIHKIISKADVIFVNNYAFDPALNQALVVKFLGYNLINS
jgi:hypothetical protein